MRLGVDIENISTFKKVVLLILPSLVIAVSAVTVYMLPLIEEMNRLDIEVKKQKGDIEAAQKSSEKFPALIAENERLMIKLLELQQLLPEEKEVSGLLRQVSQLAIRSGIQIRLWKPRGMAVHPGKEVYEIPVDVEMRGSYHRFGIFLSNIARLDRIVNISNIGMKAAEQKGAAGKRGVTELNVSFTALTYSVIPEKEKKELEKKEAEKKEDKKK